jgi:hypothetical protein
VLLSIVLGAFENRVLRRIYGHKRDEVVGWLRKLHNKELHEACSVNEGEEEHV